MADAASDTQYFVLTPRAGEKGSEALQRGRSTDRVARAATALRSKHEEEEPEVGASTARQRAVAEVMEAQIKEREKLCVFKSAGDGNGARNSPVDGVGAKGLAGTGQHSTCSACNHAPLEEEHCTPTKWPETLRQEELSSTPSRRAHLTKPTAPRLRTAERNESRSLSVGSRSCSEPPREFHSFAEMVTSFNEKGVRYTRAGHHGSPERSVQTAYSVRSARSVSSSRGRIHCTTPLTFPRAPVFATEARSESRCCSRSVSRGSVERSVRSTYSDRTPTRQSEVPLTVPCGPTLATEKRSRSRSVQSRTPSVKRSEGLPSLGEKCRSLPRVALQGSNHGCNDKATATAATARPKLASEKGRPADENAKPVSENAKPVSENAKPVRENAKPVSENASPEEESIKHSCEDAKIMSEKDKRTGEGAKPGDIASKESAKLGGGQKPQSRGPLSQLNITDYLPGDEANDKLPARAAAVRSRTVSELERTQADDKERLFRFSRRKGSHKSPGWSTSGPVE